MVRAVGTVPPNHPQSDNIKHPHTPGKPGEFLFRSTSFAITLHPRILLWQGDTKGDWVLRALHRLTAIGVKNAPPGKHPDGGGLWLHKRDDGGGQWVLRVTVHGRRREMGLGSAAMVTLKDARDAAQQWRAMTQDNLDPIKERERQRRASGRSRTLADIADEAFEARKAELRGDGVAGRWFSPLERHILPRLGKVPVSEIDQTDIRDTLSTIWHKKAETATKALSRLQICLKHAAALGIDVDLQATSKARALLGKQRHVVTNIPAMPWKEVPAFYKTITPEDTLTHLALRLVILTGVRSMPIRFVQTSQISGDVWTVPADMMKGRKDATTDFRVPLSAEALKVIEPAGRHARDGYLFPGAKRGVISDMTLGRYMERAGFAARPHGFRSSLRDWLAEATDAPHEVAETILGHTVDSAVTRAYRRTDFIEQRRPLMELWACHVTGRIVPTHV